MKTNIPKSVQVLYAFLLGALPLGNALADDIEIYVGSGADFSGVKPNILFIIDTSGSMSGQVDLESGENGGGLFTQDPYDPNTDYPGDCVDSRYYWDDDSDFPDCNTDQYIESSAFFCQAAIDAMATSGRFMDRYGSWRTWGGTGYWTYVEDNREDRPTECFTDSGAHGNGGAGTYAAHGWEGGPWSASSSDSINWSNYPVLTFMSGNFLNWYNSAANDQPSTRLEVVQYVTKSLIDSVSNVNFGLMRFDTGAAGGMVLIPVQDISGNREAMKAVIDELKPNGGTPLSETFYEAIQYYRGEGVDFGADSNPVVSVAESRGNGDGDLSDNGDDEYISPIQYQCQKNFIVFLTDGEPTSDSHAGSRIKALPGFDSLNDSCHSSISGDCLDEAALWARNRDLAPSIAGDQNVITYMVGFAEEVSVLEETARKGGGQHYLAYNALELLNVFTNIITEILAINSTFTAPAVSVNAFNRTVHLDELFFTVFKPSERPHWNGNLKRFDLGKANPTDTDVQILDANNVPAVDPNTGFFKESARSFWTNDDQNPDGGEAALGGAAGELTFPRTIYTYTGTTATLTDTTNVFHEDNTAITKAALNIAAESDTYRSELLQWARGIDLNDYDDDGDVTDARRIMGDPLHSKPVVVTYGGTVDDPDYTVFLTTNDGYLHAVDGEDGSEEFSFIPKEMWTNLDKLYRNNAGANSKNYGLDSPISVWLKDVDKDGIVESADGDHVYLYFGQRRGGTNYYALDVTNRSAPRFLWQINKSTTGYSELGQSWSPPRVAKINVNGTVKDVIVFGGGYNQDQDDVDSYVADDEGRAVYIADATTGERIWWAGPTGSGADLELTHMTNAIPAAVRVVDMNNDDLSDRMYVGDLGGHLFRFDIINGQPVSTLVKGGAIASLGAADMATPTIEHNRRFFHTPDAALIVADNQKFINLAIGSGNQDHPLGKGTRDRLFSVRDWNVNGVPASYTESDGTLITTSDLHNATDNYVVEGNTGQKAAALDELNNGDGWYIDLVSSGGVMEGEKSLAEAVTVQGNVLFTTFTPVSAAQSNSCAPSQGLARVYSVNAKFATPSQNFNGIGDNSNLTKDDRAKTLTRGGIPPEVTVLFPESTGGDPKALVGPEDVDLDLSNPPMRTYWYEQDTGM